MRSTEAATRARRARGDASRDRLVEAAATLIAERGFGATSVGDICKAAGVAKTALYWHFESKEGLLAAVLETIGGQWIEQLRKRAYLESDPLARLHRLIDDWRALITEQPRLVRLPLFLQLEVDAETSPEIHRTLRTVFDHAERAIAQGIEDSLGPDRVRDVGEIAHTTLSLLQAAVSRTAIAADEQEIDGIFAEVKRTVLLVVLSRIPPELQREILADLGT